MGDALKCLCGCPVATHDERGACPGTGGPDGGCGCYGLGEALKDALRQRELAISGLTAVLAELEAAKAALMGTIVWRPEHVADGLPCWCSDMPDGHWPECLAARAVMGLVPPGERSRG